MKTTVYVVKAGDTMDAIARQFCTDIGTIAGFNGITNPDVITEGQILRIPVGCQDDVVFRDYTIEPGDTLFAIAKMFGTDVNTLSRLNGIPDPDRIETGRTIRVPMRPGEDSIRIYIVRDGDTLYEIGKKYGYSIEELAAYNDIIDPDRIEIGQIIRFPTPADGTLTDGVYTVRSGDTLWKIAQRFGTTVVSLINLNGLTNPDTLMPGQRLKIEVE